MFLFRSEDTGIMHYHYLFRRHANTEAGTLHSSSKTKHFSDLKVHKRKICSGAIVYLANGYAKKEDSVSGAHILTCELLQAIISYKSSAGGTYSITKFSSLSKRQKRQKRTSCSQRKTRSSEHWSKLERWQGPPHISKTVWICVVLYGGLFRHKRKSIINIISSD